jgi:hypothetical protein
VYTEIIIVIPDVKIKTAAEKILKIYQYFLPVKPPDTPWERCAHIMESEAKTRGITKTTLHPLPSLPPQGGG